jgi:methylmalonyl-CoA/ethylmalonyl-CoA epimerase
MTRAPIFTCVKQVCVVVRDLDVAVRRYWDDYGIGPWHMFRYENIEGEVDGRLVTFALRVALTRVDERFEWELVQPLDDRSVYARFLARHGEGVHHVAVDVPDVPSAVDWVGGRIESHTGLTGGLQRYAMLETAGDLGVTLEVSDYTSGWRRPGGDGMYPEPDGGVAPLDY